MIALILSMTVVTFSVEALREPVVRFFTEVFETFTRVIFVDDTSEPAPVEMEKKVPSYIPEVYSVESEVEMGALYKITYLNSVTNERIYYRQQLNDGKATEMDTEGNGYLTITVGQLEGVIYENKGTKTVAFTYGQCFFSIYGAISQEELIKIAESIIL